MRRAGTITSLALLIGLLVGVEPAGAADADARQAPRPKPSVTKVLPDTGTTAGGVEVVIKGRDLTGVKRVLFGTTKATDVRVKSARKLVVTAPPHAPGLAKVRVVTSHGASKRSTETAFTYVTPQPALTAVAPAAGPTTGGTSVTLTGRDLTGATAVRFGGSRASYRVDSPSRITATAPAHAAGQVDLTVTTPGGSATVHEAYTYVAAPELTSLSPSSGPVDGATVTLTGSGLTGATVTFGGVPGTDAAVSAGGTELTVTTPDHAAGWVDVTVVTVGGSDTLVRAYLFVGGVTLTGVSPSVGPASGGPTVTLTGSGFTDETLVLFGNKPSLDVDVAPGGSSLTALLPSHSAGLVDVDVATEGDSASLTGAFTYVDAPTLTSVSPTAGPIAGGQTVTLSGTGFRAGMQVRFGGTAATGLAVLSATQATVTTPAHAAGTVDVAVTTPGGMATLANGYTYLAAPALTSVSPTEGPTAGGQTVTLNGTGFRAGMQVSFGGTPATGLVVSSATQATVTTPAHGAGTVDVTVTTPGGSATLTNGYTYVAAPTLTSVSPVEGPAAGGQTVTLNGTGFRAGMQVSFGGTPATGLVVSSGTQATVTTPAHSAGSVDVQVSTPGGSATLSNGYTYVVAPTLGSVSPVEGPTAGGQTVTLNGTGFRAGMQVRFGGTPATGLVVSSATQATVTTPAHGAGTVDVTVTTPGGSATLTNGYTYVAAPALTAVSPNEGPTSGGQTVTLTGSGFRAGMQVSFGGAPATGLVVQSATQATVTTPAHAAATVDVVVTSPGGAATLTDGYTYVAAPTVTDVAPTAGTTAGGTSVTLTGTGFRPGTQVLFGSTPATVTGVDPDGTELTVTTPAHAAGVVDVSVSTPGGTATLDDAFTFVTSPTITSVSPTEGPSAGGTTVTLTGTGFTQSSVVTFGADAATVLAVNPAGTVLTVTTPAHAAGAVDVTVSVPGGSATLDDAYTFLDPPAIDALSPASGPAAGGTTVTVTGTALATTSAVTFDGIPGTGLVVVSDTEVTVVTPSHAAGAVDVRVVTSGGSATDTNAYTFVQPTLTGIDPEAGPSSGGTTVTLTGSDLTGATSVTFGGDPATNLDVVDDDTVTVTTPPHAAGTVDVVVTTPHGPATLADGYTFVDAPTILTVSPASGPAAGGTTVTVTGTGLATTSAVTFGGTPGTDLVVVSDGEVTVTTPAHAVGTVDVQVTTASGSAFATGAFDYLP